MQRIQWFKFPCLNYVGGGKILTGFPDYVGVLFTMRTNYVKRVDPTTLYGNRDLE